VGGMSVFKLESSDTNDRPFARLASFTRAFLAIYVLLTLVCMVAYDLAGMSHFDALNHAMSTVSTAGFSTHDISFAFYDSEAILVIGTIFLTIGSLPFSVLILLAIRRRLDTLRDPQILVFIGYLCVFSILLGVYHHLRNGVEIDTALIHSFFNMASILSTGGHVDRRLLRFDSRRHQDLSFRDHLQHDPKRAKAVDLSQCGLSRALR
jgi:trk system potassium uptake protein TrkH